jgi:hypothetical protein
MFGGPDKLACVARVLWQTDCDYKLRCLAPFCLAKLLFLKGIEIKTLFLERPNGGSPSARW